MILLAASSGTSEGTRNSRDRGWWIMNDSVQSETAQSVGTKPERRRYARHRCELPIELRTPGSAFPTQGQTTDVSLGGCYVSTRFNLPVGTKVDLKLWVDGVPLVLQAVVRTSDPGVGQGMQFLNLEAMGEQMLNDYFAHQDSDSPAPEPSLRDMLII